MICYEKFIRLNLRLDIAKERINDLEERLKNILHSVEQRGKMENMKETCKDWVRKSKSLEVSKEIYMEVEQKATFKEIMTRMVKVY